MVWKGALGRICLLGIRLNQEESSSLDRNRYIAQNRTLGSVLFKSNKLTYDPLYLNARTLWVAVLMPRSLSWAKCQTCSCGRVCSLPPRSTTKLPVPATSPVMSSPGVSPWWNSTGVSQNTHLTLVINDAMFQMQVRIEAYLRYICSSTGGLLWIQRANPGRIERLWLLQRFTRLANRIPERFT